MRSAAAEAHWQRGKVEVRGGWFGSVLDKVIAEFAPHDRQTWEECVTAPHNKNELIQVHGMTPAQFVFGRNPIHALMDEPLSVIPATASLYEDQVARTVAIRQTARKAVLKMQDDKALRLSLAARPRNTEPFSPEARIAYWRTQKNHEEKVERGGRWHGPAAVLGNVGQNVVTIHQRNIFRCVPQQVRLATSEDRTLMDTPEAENLNQNNALQSRQYVDLIRQAPPPASVDDSAPVAAQEAPVSAEAPPVRASVGTGFNATLPGTSPETPTVAPNPEPPATLAGDSGRSQPTTEREGYGPFRRIRSKTRADLLHRPRAMLQDDFQEMMQEVVPQLISSQSGFRKC